MYEMKAEKTQNQTCVLYGTNHGVNLEMARNLQLIQHQRWKRKDRAPTQFCNAEYGRKLADRENRLTRSPQDPLSFLSFAANDYDIQPNIKNMV